jgi:hypothetical protein
MRTFYPSDAPNSSADQSSSSTTGQPQKINWSTLGNHASQLFNKAEQYSGATPTPYGSNYNYGNSYIPPAVRNLTGSGHLPSAAPNPATMPFEGGESAREAEHERFVNTLRARGYSDERIRMVDPNPRDPPGTKYKMVNGIKYRDDGMTPQQALHNITTNGVMNTPISTDPNYYAPGTYGWYRAHGGQQNYDEWLHGSR